MSNLVRLFRHLSQWRPNLWRSFAIGIIVAAVLALCVPLATRFIIDFGILQNNLQIIIWSIAVVVFVHVVTLFINFSRYVVMSDLADVYYLGAVGNYMRRVLNRPIADADEATLKKEFEPIHESDRVERFILAELNQCAASVAALCVLFPVLMIFSLKMAVIFCISAAIYFFILFRTELLRGGLDEDRHRLAGEARSSQHNALISRSDAQSWGVSGWLSERVSQVMMTFRKALWRTRFFEARQEAALNFISRTNSLLTLAIMSLEAYADRVSIGTLFAVIVIMNQLYYSFDLSIKSFRSLREAGLSHGRLLPDGLDAATPENRDTAFANGQAIAPSISVAGLCFERDGKQVLDAIDFQLEPGSFTSLVGSSGSGKTSLALCLAGLVTPTKGRVLANGYVMSSELKQLWAAEGAFLLQGASLFEGSLEENIILDRPLDQARLQRALELAVAEEIVRKKALSFRVSPLAPGLSSGQVQRILLARAFYRDPRFLILDEAMSGLDARTELLIVEAITSELKDATRLMVTHRMEINQCVDRVLVLEDGAIVQQGSPTELANQVGRYSRLLASGRPL